MHHKIVTQIAMTGEASKWWLVTVVAKVIYNQKCKGGIAKDNTLLIIDQIDLKIS